MEPRFRIGDRVVTPDGTVATVVSNTIEANGVRTTLSYTSRCIYPQSELELADPDSVTTAAVRGEQLREEREKAKAAEVARAQAAREAASKTKPAKKRR